MIWVIAIPLELEMYKWIKLDGSWVFNTEYGHICCNFKYYVFERLMMGVRREWPSDAKNFNPRDRLLMMVVIDELMDRNLPHHHIGIYLRYIENIGE